MGKGQNIVMPSTIRLPTPAHFSFQECLHFLNRGYAECLYTINEKSVTRLINLKSGVKLITVSADDCQLLIKIIRGTNDSISCDEIKNYVVDWFDLDRDLTGFYLLLKSHKQTENFPRNYYGLRLMGIVDLFETLCWCVIGQQINLTFAHKIKTRLVHQFGNCLVDSDNTYYSFPTPETLLAADREDLVAMQFSKQKINYIYNISQAFCSSELNKQDLLELEKTKQMEKLLAIKGIGPWTANYASMKSLRDMTCIAYGDTGLSLSLHQTFATDRKPDKSTIDTIFKPYAGWESYLNFYLWRSLSS